MTNCFHWSRTHHRGSQSQSQWSKWRLESKTRSRGSESRSIFLVMSRRVGIESDSESQSWSGFLVKSRKARFESDLESETWSIFGVKKRLAVWVEVAVRFYDHVTELFSEDIGDKAFLYCGCKSNQIQDLASMALDVPRRETTFSIDQRADGQTNQRTNSSWFASTNQLFH